MKKMKNLIIILSGIIIFSTSCTKPDTNILNKEENNSLIQNTLYKGKTKYLLFFENTDYFVGFSSLQSNPLSKYRTVTKISDDINKLKNSNTKLSIYANGIEIGNSVKKNQCAVSEQLYGKNVSFVFKNKTVYKSGNTDSVTMYIPELVSITSPPVNQPEDLLPLCYYENFILKWNADTENKNGLVVTVEWLGKVYGDKDQETFVRNVDIIPKDDGEVVLNKNLFKDIPNFAMVHITLLRGNIDTANIENDSYKIFGESHTDLHLVLVKDLNHYRSLLE